MFLVELVFFWGGGVIFVRFSANRITVFEGFFGGANNWPVIITVPFFRRVLRKRLQTVGNMQNIRQNNLSKIVKFHNQHCKVIIKLAEH